jgi:hypothetical protein
MKSAIAAAMGLVIATATALAQPAAPPQSAYCVSASGGFLSSEAQGFAELKKCQRGDTVIIPAGSASVVARVCDFSRAVVASGGSIICVVQGERSRR